MKYSTAKPGFPAGNPIANIFVIIIGALAIGVSVVLGFVAFVVLGSIVAVLAAVIGLRLWWFNRKLRRQASRSESDNRSAPGGVIEGEFHVIDDDRDRKD
ncbi:MAG: hypothetical protein KJO01_13175 [Gammaproteobacteria bacterium]|nr:hypothetical protein [Gammaproteobacteria bacterium]MBT8111027.1 hypothetical protein [Gammaproteobacteria bacterium]NND48463.1 hypothetical protein [Woeseiaceae bacterium]NNL45725.1 hypothetical protein [Woeseiaceae bacterium]